MNEKILVFLMMIQAALNFVCAQSTLAEYLEQVGAYKQISSNFGTLKGGVYVTFGAFPQTIKAKDVAITDTVEVLNGASVYKGSDGAWYVKVNANPYRVSSNYKNTCNTCSDGTKLKSGIEYYFKIEPVKWRVLTNDYNGKKLLLAENILNSNIQYHSELNNYKNSTIRAYLNDDFLNTAFTKSQQAKIAVTNVDNSAGSTTDAEGNLDKATSFACENTNDKIFLLSEKEVTTKSYGFDEYDKCGKKSSRIRTPTDYARANYCWQYTKKSGYGSWWWLRSPYSDYRITARGVSTDGDACHYNYVTSTNGGVVPAIVIED